MNNQSYEITVDTRKSISHSNIEFSQNNLNISELIFNITEDGKNFTLNDTDKIIVYFEKPDKTVVFQDKEVELLDKEKGKIKVLLTSQTLVKAGDVKGQISIERTEDGTRKRVNTYDFSFKVRSSIASNDSIESTNEFQIFDKIMVAGEKFKDFEGEDFDKLIAAGELAKGALPKTGGTMTGNLIMDGSRDLSFTNANSDTVLRNNSSGIFAFYDKKNNNVVWSYNPVSKEFKLDNASTNLYKKTDLYPNWLTSTGTATQLGVKTDLNTVIKSGVYSGYDLVNSPDGTTKFFYVEVLQHYNDKYILQRATTLTSGILEVWNRRLDNTVWGAWVKQIDANGGTMTGDLVMNTDKNLSFASDDYLLKIRGQKGNSKIVAQVFRPDGSSEFIGEYRGDLNRFTLNCDTNLLKKTGDTLTGSLNFDVKAGASKAIRGIIDGQVQSGLLLEQSGFQAFDWKNNKQVFQYLEATNTFNVTAANTNLVTKTKDGRATITVTADAELITSYGVIADRRGNTVTLRAPIRRKVGSTNGHVFTLPADMRPTMMLTQVVHASDGTPALMTIPSDTGQVLLQTITPAIMGKDYHIVLTYVAD